MSARLAYHSVVHALEARKGYTPKVRFALAVQHVIEGHLPYLRYHAAGEALGRQGIAEGSVERHIADWYVCDLNPAVQTVRNLRSYKALAHAYNAYNDAASLGVRTYVPLSPKAGIKTAAIDAKRKVENHQNDPTLCADGALIFFKTLQDSVALGVKSKITNQAGLTHVARYLGTEASAAYHVAQVLDSEGHVSVEVLSKQVGCRLRTLERRLCDDGLTIEKLRRAHRLIRATELLKSTHSLVQIAAEVGFVDQAHMTRSFRSSCAMTPGQLQRLIQMD